MIIHSFYHHCQQFTVINEHFTIISLKLTIIRSFDHHWEAAPTAFKHKNSLNIMIGWFNPWQTAGFELEYGVYTPVVSGLGNRSPWSRGRLKKIAGAEAAWKKVQEPDSKPLKNYLAPQPCVNQCKSVIPFAIFLPHLPLSYIYLYCRGINGTNPKNKMLLML